MPGIGEAFQNAWNGTATGMEKLFSGDVGGYFRQIPANFYGFARDLGFFPDQGKELSYDSFNGDWLGYLKYRASQGDEASLDRLMNYLMSEHSNQIARDWTAQREDSQYQRLVADMRAAGINPYAMLQQSGAPISSSSSGTGYSGNPYISNNRNYQQNQVRWASVILNFVSSIFATAASSTQGLARTVATAAAAGA